MDVENKFHYNNAMKDLWLFIIQLIYFWNHLKLFWRQTRYDEFFIFFWESLNFSIDFFV